MQDDLDRLIDCGLAGYSSAEPLVGLEQRVLRRVRSVRRRRRWGLVLIPAAAVLVLAVLPPKHSPGTAAKLVPPAIVEREREPIGAATVRERLPQARRSHRRVQAN